MDGFLITSAAYSMFIPKENLKFIPRMNINNIDNLVKI